MKKTGIFLAVVMLVPLSLSQEATYEQTRKWIVPKITDEAGSTIHIPGRPPYVSSTNITTSYEHVSMDECKLQFTAVVFNSGLQITGPVSDTTKPTITTHAVSIPLDKVVSVKVAPHTFRQDKDSQTVVVDQHNVSISASTNVITSKRTEKRGDEVLSQEVDRPTSTETISFGRSPATDAETANRMQKALSRAVSLCTRVKDKEPF